MVGPGLIERLWALGDRHSPRRVLVLTPDEVGARWVSSLLSERGVVVGLRVLSLEGLLHAAMSELVGAAWTRAQLSGWVREALVEDPGQRFVAVADHPSYQRALLRAFVELERGCRGQVEGLEALDHGPRDPMLVSAFGRFRQRLPGEGGWWRGEAPVRVIAGRERVSFLRRRAAGVAIGFVPDTTARWQAELLEALGFERWSPLLGVSATSSRAGKLDLRLSCAGPEAEIAATSRHLRAEPGRPAAILCPAFAVSHWAARLAHRDVPVRAYVGQPAAHTAAGRTVTSLLELLAEPTGARRGRLETILFGPALRPWSALAEASGIDYPRGPHPGDLDEAWQQQRASFFALAGLAERLRAAAAARVEELESRAARLGWSADDRAARQQRAEGARLLLAAALDRLDAVAREGPAGLYELLEDWDLLGRAAIHGVEGPEMIAARVSVDLARRAREAPLAELSFARLATVLDHALSASVSGRWEQRRAEGGGPPVWIVPYASATSVGALPERVIMTGLDAHPRPPKTGGGSLLSDRLRAALGLVEERQRFAVELRILDELASRPGQIVASWRHRDGTGARRPPGPWIAGRQDQGREQVIGVDAIALAPGPTPRAHAPHEQRLTSWQDQPLLRRRVEAIRSHEAPEVGPHTGSLGVALHPSQPYSASALQRYATLPYAYFVERVIGLREREKASDSAASLLAREQGQVVHRALEMALARALKTAEPLPLNLGQESEALFEAVVEALAKGYEARARHGQAEAIWSSERDRWLTELRHWWARWDQRMRAGAGQDPSSDPSYSGSRSRPEPEVLIPGPLLLATEWSIGARGPSDDAEVLELELLGLRTIPFVGMVDRIELDLVRQRIDIVDYKTGRPVPGGRLNAELRAGAHLQLPLYALAVGQIVARDPNALRLPGPFPVGALRLEYLQRPLPRGPRPPRNEARGFVPTQPLGVDAYGNKWTILSAAASFCLAFVSAIEAGHFPLVARVPVRRPPGSDRFAELARVVLPASQRTSALLPPSLAPLPDPEQAREVVR